MSDYTKHDCEYLSDPESGKCDICYEIGDRIIEETQRLEAELAEYKNVAEKLDNLQQRQREELGVANLKKLAVETANGLLKKEIAELREKLEIFRKENRGTMHGRHESTLRIMSEFLKDESEPYSPRPTELRFWEWVKRLTSELEEAKKERDAEHTCSLEDTEARLEAEAALSSSKRLVGVMRKALTFSKGAIQDAIGCDDGLDGAAGEAVIDMIDEALAKAALNEESKGERSNV